jgi:hypothetical protein
LVATILGNSPAFSAGPAGEWTYQQLSLRVEDDPGRLDLLEPANAAPKEK